MFLFIRGEHPGFGSVFRPNQTEPEKSNLVQNPNRTESEKPKNGKTENRIWKTELNRKNRNYMKKPKNRTNQKI